MLFLNAKNCWQQIHKPTIVQHNDRNVSKKSGFPFPSGFRDFEKTNQTEQTVNRKKSGFRTARLGAHFFVKKFFFDNFTF